MKIQKYIKTYKEGGRKGNEEVENEAVILWLSRRSCYHGVSTVMSCCSDLWPHRRPHRRSPQTIVMGQRVACSKKLYLNVSTERTESSTTDEQLDTSAVRRNGR